MSFLNQALSLAADLSFAVFPVHGVYPDGKCTCASASCANIGKHPATANGFKSASKDHNVVLNLFTSSRPYNVGIATGAISGIFVLDVDGMEGEASLRGLPALPKTLTSLTGNGRHLIFRHPGVKIASRTSKLGPKLDIRGDGGYIVAPPSIHRTGVCYSWDANQGGEIATAPQWLIDMVKADAPEATPTILPVSPLSAEWSLQDVEAMLGYIDPDLNYHDWINIGMALHEGGYPMAVFNNWSAKGSKYKSVKDIEFHWRSFHAGGGITMGTLVNTAMLNGWKPIYAPDEALLNIGRQAAENIMANIKLKSVSASSAPLVIDFDNIPGIIGQTVQWILSNAQKPQPELALMNTLAALGAVFGRRYRSPLDTRTNIYMVGIAGTAAGKGHSKKAIKSLMADAGLSEFIGSETIVSGAGLLSDVFKQPSQVMHLDEFGMLLEAIMDKRGASHLKIASKIMTELYSNSSEKYIGGQYADKKQERTIIANPNLCIYGLSTLEKYTSSLNRDAITSGELNRFIVFRATEDSPKRRRGIYYQKPPEWLVSAWRALKPLNVINNGMIEVDADIVEWHGLQERIDDMGDFEDEMIAANRNNAGALWGRYRENVIKVAMITAISKNHITPVIASDDLDFAEAVVRQSVDFMIDMVNEHLSDSQHEKDCNDILNSLRKKGPRLSQSQLCSMTRRMDPKQREAAIESLLDRGIISIETPAQNKGAGRRGRFICLTKN